MTSAAFILDAIHRKYSQNAIVPELTINDPYWHDWAEYGLRHHHTEESKAARRIDALMMQSFERTAIEIKVTKQDYMLDTEHKRRPWKRVVHRFIYAVPEHLDVMAPHGCGLWKVDGLGNIRVIKKAIINRHPEHLPQDVIQRLMYRAGGMTHHETPEMVTTHG